MVVPLQTRLMEVAGRAQSMAAAMEPCRLQCRQCAGAVFAGMAGGGLGLAVLGDGGGGAVSRGAAGPASPGIKAGSAGTCCMISGGMCEANAPDRDEDHIARGQEKARSDPPASPRPPAREIDAAQPGIEAAQVAVMLISAARNGRGHGARIVGSFGTEAIRIAQ